MTKKTSSSNFSTLIALLALLLAAVSIGIVLFGQKLPQAGISQSSNTVQRELNQIKTELGDQHQRLVATQSQIQTLNQVENTDQLKLQQARYYVQLAHWTLMIEQNPTKCMMLLTEAKKYIQSAANPNFSELETALNKNLSELQNAPSFNLPETMNKLLTLNNQIKQLPLAKLPNMNKPEATDQTEAETDNANEPTWKKGLDAGLNAMKKVVTIRHNQPTILPIRTPKEREFLMDNIQLQLASAQWALLNQQPEVYLQSLNQVLTWIQNYYNMDVEVTQLAIRTINELKKTNIKPPQPDIAGTLNLFDTALLQPLRHTQEPQQAQDIKPQHIIPTEPEVLPS